MSIPAAHRKNIFDDACEGKVNESYFRQAPFQPLNVKNFSKNTLNRDFTAKFSFSIITSFRTMGINLCDQMIIFMATNPSATQKSIKEAVIGDDFFILQGQHR